MENLNFPGMSRQSCSIFAFYSYKGGVGRTMALCNCAAYLSRTHEEWERETKKYLNIPEQNNFFRPLKILCVDLDLEAPGLPAFFPPPKESSPSGFLGLIKDHFSESWGEKNLLEEKLKLALSQEFLKYGYKASGASNLFILPVGSISKNESAFVRAELHKMLIPLIEPNHSDADKDEIPFFNEFKKALNDSFDYVLIDSRTGLSDTAYATTIILADAMIFLFRPNLTQLEGIQDVFGRFLTERGLLVSDKNIPAIPVLSPLPISSDLRIYEVKKVISKNIFRWLDKDFIKDFRDEEYIESQNSVIEIPFDPTLEIGERLVFQLGKCDKDDFSSPVERAYKALTHEIMMKNAFLDPLGTRQHEYFLYKNGRVCEAFTELLWAIRKQPFDQTFWLDIEDGYYEHLEKEPKCRGFLALFCHKASESFPQNSIPVFFAKFWLSVVKEIDSPQLGIPFIREVWRIAKETMAPNFLQIALKRLLHFYTSSESFPDIEEFPTKEEVIDANAWLVLSKNPNPKDIFSLSRRLFNACNFPTTTNKVFFLLKSQLLLTKKSVLQTEILRDIADFFIREGDIAFACRTLFNAVQNEHCPESIKGKFIGIFTRITSEAAVNSAVEKYIAKKDWPRYKLLQKNRLSELQEYSPEVGKSPISEFYSLVHKKKFSEATLFFEKCKEIWDEKKFFSNMIRFSTIKWLNTGEQVPEHISSILETKIELKEEIHPIEDGLIIIWLISSPDKLCKFARAQLKKPQWLLHRVGWLFWACLSEEDSVANQNILEDILEKKPFVGAYIRRFEGFPIISFILERLRKENKINRSQSTRMKKGIQAFEKIQPRKLVEMAPYFSEEEMGKVSDPSDPGFVDLISQWKKTFNKCNEDPCLRDVLNKILRDGN